MQTFTYVIQDPMGLHARPAGLLAKAAMAWPCSITVSTGTDTGDAKRLMSVMRLAAKQGMELTITCDGEKEEEAAAAMEAFLKENL